MKYTTEDRLAAYRALVGYTIVGTEKAIVVLKDACKLDVPNEVLDIYKARIQELEWYLEIIKNDY